MTAKEFRNIAACAAARLREAARHRTVADTEWQPVVALQLLSCNAAQREIAANGFTFI
jgi:hypothetical protein